jgi:peptide/nickel transport system permease protein
LLQYSLRRLAQAVPLLLLVSFVSYMVMNLAPGGPLAVYLHNPEVSPDKLQLLGLDRPWYERYFTWLWQLLHGNWGYSYFTGRPVMAMIAERLPATLELMVAAFLISLGLSLPAGIYAATHRYTWFDNLLSFGAFFAWAMPTFWFGLMMQLIFAVHLGLLPVGGMYSDFAPPSFGELLRHIVMPALVLGLGSIASWSRYLRSGIVEELGQDYVRTALAKGLSFRTVVNRHVLRNGLIPVVTLMGLDLPAFFGGAVITESVFAWPGMGRLFLEALNNRDYPVQMAGLMIGAALLIVGNLLADLAYAWLDPRISYN